MPKWWTRKRTVWLIVVAVLILLGADAFVTPPAHDVHTSGGIPINARWVDSKPPLFDYQPVKPSQSLDEIRCQFWRFRNPAPTSACPDSASLASTFFPDVAQSPTTLYIPWYRCAASFRGWDGYNVEYQSSSGTIVIHCYVAEPWLLRQPVMMGVMARQSVTLLLVPTQSISVGPVRIVEDDREEHLLGDQSSEWVLGTARIDRYAPPGTPSS
jgi:hypothetical protein